MTEIKSSEQIMRGEFDILENIDSQAECDDYMDEVGHKRKWVSFEDYKKLRSELEEAKKTIREYKEYNFNTNNKLKEKKNQVIIYIDDEKTDKIIKMFKEISRGEE